MPVVYSERFLSSNPGGITVFYTVPAARRAVIRSIVIANRGGTTTVVQVGYADTVLVQFTVQVGQAPIVVDCRVPVYAGEVMFVYTSNAGSHATVGGYLFDDTTGARGPGPPSATKPSPEPPI